MKTRKVILNGTEFELGKKYKAVTPEIEGVAIAGCTYLTGCDQIQLSFNDSTGRPCEYWVHVTDILDVEVENIDGGPSPVMQSRHP